jgi:hypothetical protein
MTRASDACDRLAASRGQLRQAILAARRPAAPKPVVLAGGWLDKVWVWLKTRPVTRPLAQGVDAWIANSRLPASGRLAADALDTMLRPMAQQHPGRLVLSVFVLSALLVWRRPWRRLVSPALVLALLPPLLNARGGNATRPTWITLAAALLDRQPKERAP